MESEYKSEIMSKDEPLNSNEGGDVIPQNGDGMNSEVEPDRFTKTDDGYTVKNPDGSTQYLKMAYDTETDVSAVGGFADHLNSKTGELETLGGEGCECISSVSEKKLKEKWLNKKYQPKDPIIQGLGDKAPTLNDLVDVGVGEEPDWIVGTPDRPSVQHTVVPHSLFIDGMAHQEDIRQGNLGDCYFLAALFQVIHYDPMFFPKIMHVHGDEVYTELCHQEGDPKTGYHWVRKPIAVKWGVNKRGKAGSSLSTYGAHYRVKYDPEKDVRWEAAFNGTTLKFSKTMYYQAAMWVQCLERAYADFTRIYGPKGDGQTRYKERYMNIHGGTPTQDYRILFGEDVVDPSMLKEKYIGAESDEKSLMDVSSGMLGSLVSLSQTQDGSQPEQTYLTVHAFNHKMIPRIEFYANRIMATVNSRMSEATGVDKQSLADAAQKLQVILDKLAEYAKTKCADGTTEGEKTSEQVAICREMSDAELSLVKNTTFTDLNLTDFISLQASMGTLIDSKGSNVYILTSHEYNIREVHFVDKKGEPVDPNDFYAYYVDGVLTPDYDPNAVEPEPEQEEPEQEEPEEKLTFWQKLFGKRKDKEKKEEEKPKEPVHVPVVEFKMDFDQFKEFIDIDKSYAVIQNPHAKTKAVYKNQTEAKTAVGTWTTSLRELFSGVSTYTAVTIRTGDTSNTGKGDVKAVEGIGGAKEVKKEGSV